MRTSQLTEQLRGHPIRRFVIIAIVGELLLAGLLLATGGDAAIERALAAADLQFNTDLITALHLAIVYPAAIAGIALSIAQVAAPDLAVLALTRGVPSGPASLAAVRSRFRFWSKDTTARQGLLIWAQMTVTFIALSVATAGLDHLWLSPQEYQWRAPSLTGGPVLGSVLGLVIGLVLGLAVAMFLDAGALLEENGWRGYALPLLLLRHRPVTASVILGLGWAAWHFPVKYNAITDYGIGGVAYLGAFTLKIVLLSIVITYFWQRVGQATLIAIAMHGLSNDSLRLQGELIGDSLHLSIISELTIALPLAVAAAFLVSVTQGRLGAAGEPRSVLDPSPPCG